MLIRYFSLLAFLVVFGAARLEAVISTMDDIAFWVGEGENQAALVIDWNDGIEPQSFAWGFRWDGTATGYDMFNAVASADPELALTTEFFPSVGNDAVDGIRFELGTVVHDEESDGFVNGFWSYWIADDSESLPTSGEWTFPKETGWEVRELSNNSWDGWSWAAAPEYEGTAPSAPLAAPIPEASTGILFALAVSGWFVLTRSRRGRRFV